MSKYIFIMIIGEWKYILCVYRILCLFEFLIVKLYNITKSLYHWGPTIIHNLTVLMKLIFQECFTSPLSCDKLHIFVFLFFFYLLSYVFTMFVVGCMMAHRVAESFNTEMSFFR